MRCKNSLQLKKTKTLLFVHSRLSFKRSSFFISHTQLIYFFIRMACFLLFPSPFHARIPKFSLFSKIPLQIILNIKIFCRVSRIPHLLLLYHSLIASQIKAALVKYHFHSSLFCTQCSSNRTFIKEHKPTTMFEKPN